MLSFKTCIELINVIDNYVVKVVDRIFFAFEIDNLIHPSNGKFSKDDKLNLLLKSLKYPPIKGPFTDSFQIDLLQYIADHFYRYEDDPEVKNSRYYPNNNHILYEDRFSYKYQALANSLKRDGYIIKGRAIKKLLPKEIEETKTESELFSLLNKFDFTVAKGHLEQAISNHSQGNWAGANAQFRPFIESLFIDICRQLAPNNNCDNASSAIKILSKTVSPPFLKEELNEVENKNCSRPFIEGFWKRLHPQGNHPGLSDEDDSTFRYHLSIVVAYNLLNRLAKRT